MHGETDPDWALATLCRAVYDPRRDDADFRRSLGDDPAAQKLAFDLLRKGYPVRREIEGLQVKAEGQEIRRIALALGCVVKD